MGTGTPWADEELRILREGAAAGDTPTTIAARLPGRSRMAVGGKLTRLREETGFVRSPPPEPGPREGRRPIPPVSGSTLPPLASQCREA